jgi:hypothetical protein
VSGTGYKPITWRFVQASAVAASPRVLLSAATARIRRVGPLREPRAHTNPIYYGEREGRGTTPGRARTVAARHALALKAAEGDLGFGRVVALYHRSSTTNHIFEEIRCPFF